MTGSTCLCFFGASLMVTDWPSMYHRAFVRLLITLCPSSAETALYKRFVFCISFITSLCKAAFRSLPFRGSNYLVVFIKTSLMDWSVCWSLLTAASYFKWTLYEITLILKRSSTKEIVSSFSNFYLFTFLKRRGNKCFGK